MNETAEDSRFGPKLADEIVGEVARRLSWLWHWQQALHLLYAQSDLKTLVNGWLGTRAVPAMAYAYVEDTIYWTHSGKYNLYAHP